MKPRTAEELAAYYREQYPEEAAVNAYAAGMITRDRLHTPAGIEQFGGRLHQEDNKYLNPNHIYTSDKDISE